ncbi:FAD-binding oxidoreductase [Prevotella sp. A2931]|uniref:D-lactate dehydrogenase (cytochrome) n=1 Tax=Prevotella illustrans TaxID=2800387 RepID=A0ABS3M3Z2_9BACT|nr:MULTISPECIES: FAD-binding and (Fe-S)-binding domain-containing protein [Prevotella]MBO1362887.1 FAD-binding oxidoreductase [Prevotella illustrans]PTL25949.1 4Fe-4S ferredoxin [Prevotella sp. oral taxon 820]
MEPLRYDLFLNDIRQFLDNQQIYTDELRTFAWGTDAGFYRLTPKVVIRSNGERQLSKIIQVCDKYRIPYTFRAAGTSLSGQSVSDSVLIVAGKNWERYEILEDGQKIRLQPGVVGGKVNQILKPLGRVFPPDPASIGSAMVGGIVSNNASGMNCGVHANSDRMLVSARLVLSDGTIVDTGSEESKEAFRKSHPQFILQLEQLRDKVRANTPLADRIRYKYSIKNVTGLNLRPLIAYDDPFEIMAHCMVGSEGTLAFLSEVTMKTLKDYPFKASAMVYFKSMRESCEAIVKLKELISSVQDLAMSAENLMVKSAETLDYKSLSAVNDPIFLQYQKDVDAHNVSGVTPGNYQGLTAVLTETKAVSHEALQQNINTILDVLRQFDLYRPTSFTEDPEVYGKYWAIRSGIFPSVGGTRPIGTSCLIEDVAFHIEDLPEATVKLQKLIADHGYDDACIYGHAFAGNYHFILNQSFKSDTEVKRYEKMMRDVTELVVKEFDGSLKAEHGTGRNMAPFVRYEWGDEAFEVMKELKAIFDPKGLLNPGVIFNDDPNCFTQNLKDLPELRFPYEKIPDGEKYLTPEQGKSSTQAMIQGVKDANKCIECGFCEVNCVSCGLTLSSRMRIAIQREISRLEETGENPTLLQKLREQYRYPGDQTCASDGLCATSCPMKINTGNLTHLIRQLNMLNNNPGYKAGEFGANHMAGIKNCLRGVLDLAHLGHSILGDRMMTAVTEVLHKAGMPLWTVAMPCPTRQPQQPKNRLQKDGTPLKVVYFPSCINQTMGLAKGAPVKNTVVDEMVSLMNKAGYEVIFPEGMQRMCCGQIWESKGMMDIADRKSAELEEALWKASEEGRYPVVCDQSPCLHRMRKVFTKMKLYEPVEFIMTYLKDRLVFHPTHKKIAIHVTCSTREMGLTDRMIELATLCSDHVLVPDGIGCCAFAGDKGFTHPELNRYALRKLRPQIEKAAIEVGYSNSRTCEIGLQTNSGIPYLNIAYLVNETTEAK